MREIRLGRTEAVVPVIGLGTWAHGGEMVIGGQAEGWSSFDSHEARRALLRAFEVGIVHWDTADIYGFGRAERLVGDVLLSVQRDQVFLASKVGFDTHGHEHGYTAANLRTSIEESLSRLGVDYLDLYYFHHTDFGPGYRYLDEAVATMRALRAEGKVRWIGLSDWDVDKLAAAAEAVDPDVVQVYRNVVDDRYRGSRLEHLVGERDLGVVFFSVLQHGALLGRHDGSEERGPGDIRGRLPAFTDPEVVALLRAARPQVEERFAALPVPTVGALTGVLMDDAPSAALLLGMRTVHHVEQAQHLGQPLDATEAAWLRGLFAPLRDRS